MNATNTEEQSGSMDLVKWILVIVLLASAVVGNYIYGEEISLLIRVIGVLAAIGIAGAIATQTEKGRTAVSFAKESRLEIRKVVWPTRKEATNHIDCISCNSLYGIGPLGTRWHFSARCWFYYRH